MCFVKSGVGIVALMLSSQVLLLAAIIPLILAVAGLVRAQFVTPNSPVTLFVAAVSFVVALVLVGIAVATDGSTFPQIDFTPAYVHPRR